MKSTIFYKKSHNKYLLPGQLATKLRRKLIVTGTKDKIFILPGLGPEKVENHCFSQQNCDHSKLLMILITFFLNFLFMLMMI